ncbi:MAG TPA: FMN-binding protein, partial [Pirellulaceae bacterium]|nr:FMN-binding protein [Pirellulaceae bacterium]
SPYLLAHGMGRPLADATTEVEFPSTGEYHVFVRTKDWVARWDAPGQPGKFKLLIDGKPLAATFGTKGKEWFWHDGGVVQIEQKTAKLLDVYDTSGNAIGAVTRTSPATDTIMGYQGPTDSLIAVDQADRVLGLQIRKSYDNEPYVGYVRDETYFRERFNGLTLQELAKIDIRELGVEGVSGATMTSMAIAEGLPKTAHAALQPPPAATRRFVFTTRDVGTLLVLVAAVAISLSRMRGSRGLRIAFQLMLVVYFGFMNGDMLSQALLVGWAQSGVPWRLAPGLMLMVAASLVVPAVSKKQPYAITSVRLVRLSN